jgi:hypothetical protein
VFTLQWLQTGDWKQKGYLFPHHRLYPQIDFSYLISEQKKRYGGGEGRTGDAGRANWWGRTESPKLQPGKWLLGVGQPSPCHKAGEPAKRSQSFPRSQPPFSARHTLVAPLASLCHRVITDIISPKITQSNLYLPTSSLRSLFEIYFNK